LREPKLTLVFNDQSTIHAIADSRKLPNVYAIHTGANMHFSLKLNHEPLAMAPVIIYFLKIIASVFAEISPVENDKPFKSCGVTTNEIECDTSRPSVLRKLVETREKTTKSPLVRIPISHSLPFFGHTDLVRPIQ
jgi:hypothetical protein